MIALAAHVNSSTLALMNARISVLKRDASKRSAWQRMKAGEKRPSLTKKSDSLGQGLRRLLGKEYAG